MASILILEPYDTGSHAMWLRGYQQHSIHHLDVLSLPGQAWQWRMQGGAVTLARQFMESEFAPELIVASDMLDLTTFLALTRSRTAHVPAVMYFHENQLTYPPGPRQKHDLGFGFINYASAQAADAVFFNSSFHQQAFLEELPRLLKHYPDYNELPTVQRIQAKASVLPVGLDLHRLDQYGPKPVTEVPIILWNHRWEYDKNPLAFFNALDALVAEDIPFKVIITGENLRQKADEFEQARERLGNRLIHYGYVQKYDDYVPLLWQATHVVSCAWQDFFGISMVEAIYCGCLPLMPRRLNYPDLVPTIYHPMCLYNDGELGAALQRTLTLRAPVALRDHISHFDWSMQGPLYDQSLQAIIDG
jgi:glycosyltransferase involved in cell wall biosynthesis